MYDWPVISAGLLGVALRPFFENRVSDITIFPVGVTYDERMESHLYADEMLGTRLLLVYP